MPPHSRLPRGRAVQQLPNSFQQRHPVTQGADAQLSFELNVSQPQQQAAVYRVVGELLPVLLQTQRLNPLAHFAHCGKQQKRLSHDVGVRLT